MKLFPHQTKVLNQTKEFQNVAYYMDMGLGKTFVGSERMARIGNRVNLVVCQKSKINDWIKHLTEHYDTDYLILDLTRQVELNAFMIDAIEDPWIEIVGVINYELAWRRKELLKLRDFTLMLDESSLIQNPKAKQSKFILKLKPANVILLSGTPVGGKYENLWTQMHLLGWTISEKLYQKQYVNWETIDIGGCPIKIVSKRQPYKNIDRLKAKMREHGSVFMKTEECFDLPEQIFTMIDIGKTKQYDKFMKTGIVQIDDEELVGDTTLTKMLYARQLCGHYNQDKLTAFKDLIASTSERLIVFYSFNAEVKALKAICEDCGKPISEINGHLKDLKAYECESDSVTLVQYQAGAKGLNLQKANRIIYFTLPLSSEDFEQSKKRIHRIGQDKTCFYYLMICEGSIEEKIFKTLEQRKNYTNELFKTYFEKGQEANV